MNSRTLDLRCGCHGVDSAVVGCVGKLRISPMGEMSETLWREKTRISINQPQPDEVDAMTGGTGSVSSRFYTGCP